MISWLRMSMDENETELLRLLYTRIGMTMEDASDIALKLGGPVSAFEPDEVQKLELAVERISALTQAAHRILE
ncbi:MAG: hypothetical protein AAF249_09435 [Pseudomonadota bacterium]